MRVNVSPTVISKTFMNGLKVSPEPIQQQQQRQLSKSNNYTLEFFINFKIQQQQQFVALKEFAIFAITSQQQQQQQLYHFLIIIINIIISFNGFNRLTVLMNELRLKTFYCQNSKINKSNIKSLSNIKTTKTWSSFNKKQLLSLLTSSTTTSTSSPSDLTFHPTNAAAAAAASAVAFATSAQILLVNNPQQQQQQQTFHNNNNNRNRNYRTYNNSKKSNKIFLYYTPRDPRLRILLKTKHFFSNRPQQQQLQTPLINNNKNCCCVKNLLLSDLCNYGELIGGLSGESSVFPHNKTFIKKSINFNLICYSINCNWEICDKKASDNFVIINNLATAGAAIVTISAALNLLVVLSEFARELLTTIEILLLSFHYNHQKLKIFNIKSTFGLHDSIL